MTTHYLRTQFKSRKTYHVLFHLLNLDVNERKFLPPVDKRAHAGDERDSDQNRGSLNPGYRLFIKNLKIVDAEECNQSKLDLPVLRFSSSDTIMSTITEKHPATIKTLSMKSYKASHSFEKNPYATGFFASFVPKCSLRSGKSEPVSPFLMSTLILSQSPSSPSNSSLFVNKRGRSYRQNCPARPESLRYKFAIGKQLPGLQVPLSLLNGKVC